MIKWIIYMILITMVIQIANATVIDTIPDEWNVAYTGAEVNLGVRYDILSDVQTRFCIEIKDKTTYSDALSLSNKDISSVPITKVDSKESFTIIQTEIDFSSSKSGDESCFDVYYPEFKDTISFKIGWDSIVIDAGTAGDGALRYSLSNAFAMNSSGGLYIGYAGQSSDLYTANSTGSDWQEWNYTEIIDGVTAYGVNMIQRPNGTLSMIYVLANETTLMIMDYDGDNWGEAKRLDTFPTSFETLPSCEVNSTNTILCSYIYQGQYPYIVTTDNPSNAMNIHSNGSDDSDFCKLKVDEDDCVYLFCGGTDHDDIDVWSDCLNGWTDEDRVEIVNGVAISSVTSNEHLSVSLAGDFAYTTYIDTGDLWFCKSGMDFSSNNCSELDSASSDNPIISMNSEGQGVIIYKKSSPMYYWNTTDFGDNWTYQDKVIEEACSHTSAIDSSFPTWSRPEDKLHFVCSGGSGANDLLYFNISVDYTGSATTSFSVSLPTSTDKIVFDSPLKTANMLEPENQTNSVPILTITNTGNTNINISMYINTSLPVGFETWYNLSSDGTLKELNDSKILTIEDITPSSIEKIWLYTNFTNQAQQTFERNLTINGTNSTIV